MNEPKLRFKADDGSQFPDWEEKKVGDIFSKVKDKNKDGQNQNVITNSAEFGLINQRDFFDKDIAVDGKTENYTIIKTGDFVYNPRKSKQAPYGPFNCYQLEEDGIVSPLYTCLRPKGNADDKYLHWYFQSGSWYRFIYENGAQNGARHDRVSMTDSLMQEIPVYLPQAIEEQQKVAEFLLTIDTVIEKQKETVSAWEECKKGVMQKLFSQEVRFKADDGSDFPDTELVSIGEHITFSGGSQPDKKYFIYEEREGYIRLVQTQDYRTDKYKTYIPIEKARKTCTETDVMIGRYGPPVFQIKRGIAGAYNVALIKATEKDSSILDKEFMFYLLSRNDLFLALDAVSRRSAGQAGVDMELLKSFKFYLPSIPEQQKIVDCLSSLDEVIEKQKATLAAWEELKKGLLQQMFV